MKKFLLVSLLYMLSIVLRNEDEEHLQKTMKG